LGEKTQLSALSPVGETLFFLPKAGSWIDLIGQRQEKKEAVEDI
jgi:hypothetical protein